MKHIFFFISILVFSGFFNISTAQTEPPTSKKTARGFITLNNYREALEEFKKLWEKDSTNIEYNYSLGLCYLETNIDKSRAITYLEWVTQQAKPNINAWYDLGRAYAVNFRFDDAINAFIQYLQLTTKDDNFIPAQRWIEMCQTAKIMVSHPLNVTFIHLKNDINSPAPDFNPFVTADESLLIFTTKRAGNIGGWTDFDGFLTSDIMISSYKNDTWQKPKRMPSMINSEFVEEAVSLSPDGSHLFIYIDNYFASGDIYFSEKTGRSFSKIQPIGNNVNTKNIETSACIAPNKKIIFFAASYPDSYGGNDIYYSRKLPDGSWGVPANAGNIINTQYNEDFPLLSSNGHTLYFASTGHNSMGGFDVFRTVWNKDDMTFTEPENIGYPLNTPGDNFTISFTKSGRYAYLSAFRPEGNGDLDIYKVVFNDVPPPLHFISGRIISKDSTSVFSEFTFAGKEFGQIQTVTDSLNIVLTVTDIVNGTVYGIYRPNPLTGKFIIVLRPGRFRIIVSGNGYVSQTREIFIPDSESTKESQDIDIILLKTK